MNILVLGIGSAQVDLIKFLRNKHTIHALSYTTDGEGRKYVDHFGLVDIKNEKAVLAYAKKHNIEIVCSVGSDLGMVTAASVSEELQLPSFISSDVARICHNKYLLRAHLGDVRYNIPQKLLGSVSDVGEFEFPCIMKPVDSQGQRGVFFISNKRELEDKFSVSAKFSSDRKVVVENCIEGPEVSVNGYVINGKVEVLIISDRVVWQGHQIGLIHKHRVPSAFVKADSKKRIEELVTDVIKRIGITNGPVYFQIKLSHDTPKLIEVTPRLDGCHMWRLIKYASGFDFLEASMNHLLNGEIPEDVSHTINDTWTLEFLCQKPGTSFAADNHALDGSTLIEWYYQDGVAVTPVNGVLEKCGYKIYNSTSTEDAMVTDAIDYNVS